MIYKHGEEQSTIIGGRMHNNSRGSKKKSVSSLTFLFPVLAVTLPCLHLIYIYLFGLLRCIILGGVVSAIFSYFAS